MPEKSGYSTSYWERNWLEQNYDLLIVGAGLTGQSAALFYKRTYPEKRVLVVDRGFMPMGASTRNAGFACIGTVGELMADLSKDSEEQLKKRIKDRFEGLQLLRSTLGEDHIDYTHSGAHEIFKNEDDFESANQKIDFFNQWMNELIGEKEMYRAVRYEGYPAIFQTQEGMLHPGKMMRRLTELNMQAGVEFLWNTEVSEIRKEGSIKCNGGRLFHAERLIIATNAFTSSLIQDVSIQPGRGYVFITTPIQNLRWRGTFHYHKGYVYFRNAGNDRLLLGGARHVDELAETTAEFGINTAIKDYLIQFADEVLKLPKGWKIEQEWSGIMGFTPTKSATLKKINSRTVVAAGLSGMGVALGMKLGQSAAGLVETGAQEY